MRPAVLIRKNIFANGSEMGCQPKRSSQPYSTEEPRTISRAGLFVAARAQWASVHNSNPGSASGISVLLCIKEFLATRWTRPTNTNGA
jgi:hypothetical protein